MIRGRKLISWQKSPKYTSIMMICIFSLGLLGSWTISNQVIHRDRAFEFGKEEEWYHGFRIQRINNVTISVLSSSPGAVKASIFHYYEQNDVVYGIYGTIEPGYSWSNRDSSFIPPFEPVTALWYVTIRLSQASTPVENSPYKGNISVVGKNRDLIGLMKYDFILWIIYLLSFFPIMGSLGFLVKYSIKKRWFSEDRLKNVTGFRFLNIILVCHGIYMIIFFYFLFTRHFSVLIPYLPVILSFILVGIVGLLVPSSTQHSE